MPASSVAPKTSGTNALIRLLDTVGDGTGSTDISLNFVTATTFRIQPTEGLKYYIKQISVSLVATGGVSASGYGSGAILINGLQFLSRINGVITSLPQLNPIFSNFQLIDVVTRFGDISFQGNDTGFKHTLDFTDIGLDPIILSSKTEDEFVLIVQDDFTSRTASNGHNVVIHGTQGPF